MTTFAQFGALKALQAGDGVCSMMKDSFAKRRDLFCGLLSEIPQVSFIRPSGAFYVFADISFARMGSMEFCDRLMEKAHIAAAPGCGFGADNFIRFSYACSEDVIKRSLERFADFCSGGFSHVFK